jgi:hypothetical protein
VSAASAFKEIAQEFYPGSTRPIIRHPNRKREEQGTEDDDIASWDRNPRVYKVGGENMEFFTVGQLALALHRRPVTIRKWEQLGKFPKATYRSPSEHTQGVRRLYSRAQVEGVVQIAKAEGLFDSASVPISPKFTERVVALFTALAKS